MPKKPIKRGLRSGVGVIAKWVHLWFPVKVGNTTEKNLSARVVKDLSVAAVKGKGYHLYFDNFSKTISWLGGRANLFGNQ